MRGVGASEVGSPVGSKGWRALLLGWSGLWRCRLVRGRRSDVPLHEPPLRLPAHHRVPGVRASEGSPGPDPLSQPEGRPPARVHAARARGDSGQPLRLDPGAAEGSARLGAVSTRFPREFAKVVLDFMQTPAEQERTSRSTPQDRREEVS